MKWSGLTLHTAPALCRFQAAPAAAARAAARRQPPQAKQQPASSCKNSVVARSGKQARLEAVLLVAGGALSTRRLAHLATLADATEASTLIDQLNDAYRRSRSAFSIERVAAGYQLLSRPQFAFWLDTLHNRPATLKLSTPMMETLTIVAYQQPIVRADIESIRGVQCSEILKQLMEQRLVKVGGEDDSLGRPYLYITTRKFLETFGLRDLSDLPLKDTLVSDEPSGPDQGADAAVDPQPAETEETETEETETEETETEETETEENESEETGTEETGTEENETGSSAEDDPSEQLRVA